MRRASQAVWVLAFLIGTTTHARHLLEHGWLPYRFAPIWLNAFWTALTFLDPLAAILLIWRPRSGAVLGLAIMLIDVGVNSYMVYILKLGDLGVALQLQSLFLGFVLGTYWLVRQTRDAFAPLRSDGETRQ